ncbi:MAG: hypothetical protein HYS74_01600 [Parcubacteria group bacterium]|nr:hypothetical protein [Parcubacteria group bacterium]
MFGITFVIVFFFARRPPVFANDDKGKTLVFYKKWPTLAGHRVYPAAIFLLALAAWALWLLGYAFVAWVSDPSVGVWFAITVLLALVVLLPVVLFCILFARFLKSEAWQLFKEFIKARKQKICPFVDIVE